MAYRMTDVERTAQKEALREFVFAWWDRFGRKPVTARALSELADEKGLTFGLFIRHTNLDRQATLALRLARLLKKLDYDDVRVDRIQIHIAEYTVPLLFKLWRNDVPDEIHPSPQTLQEAAKEEGFRHFLSVWWFYYEDREASVQQLEQLLENIELVDILLPSDGQRSVLIRVKRFLQALADANVIQFTRTRNGMRHYRLKKQEDE